MTHAGYSSNAAAADAVCYVDHDHASWNAVCIQAGLSRTGSIGIGTCGACRALIVLAIGLGLETCAEDAVLTGAEDGALQQRQHGSLQPPGSLAAALSGLRHSQPVVGKPVLLRLREPPREARCTRRAQHPLWRCLRGLYRGGPVVGQPVLQVLREPPGQARLARRTEWVAERVKWRRPRGQEDGAQHLWRCPQAQQDDA